MKNSWINTILIHLGLVLLAAVLFAASFPNPIFINGLPFLAWFAYIPILIVISKYGILACAVWGALYGLTAYSLFNYWLSTFHPLAGTIVYSIYLIYMAIVFVFLKLAIIFFPKRGYLVQWVIWLAYEYLRTLGFLGYPYGITGYSQWRMLPLIQIAGITGVWGVSAIVTFPSFWLAGALSGKQSYKDSKDKLIITILNSVVVFFRKEKLSAVCWAIILTAALIFGIASNKDFSDYPTVQIAVIQHNADPWEASRAPTSWQVTEAFRKDLTTLLRLSDEALASSPKPQLVVWSETAFIPRIHWHTKYRENQEIWAIVRDLLEYLSVQDVPFLIGNDDAYSDPSRNPDPSERHRVDYNAAMLFENGINTNTYRKIHLVPFTEHFPYRKQFPWIYEWLRNADTFFWEKGVEKTVFKLPDFTFSAPICFEDTFGYLSRNFVRGGAQVLVNLSNDAWSNSLSAQYQHLTMAVFRAVENYRPMVRATSSGQTCAINPRGKVTAMAAPFEETWLNEAVPLVSKTTLYTLYGDYLAIFFTLTAVILLIFGTVWCTIRKIKDRGHLP